MRKPRVIIYDDDTIILSMFELFFSKRGYEVRLCSAPVVCPYEGISENCQTLRPCADLMISDFKMPGMTGIELFQRQTQRGCPLNIKMKAIMSGYAEDNLIRQCQRLGLRFFRKPFSFSELAAWLEEREELFDLSGPLYEKRVNSRQEFSHDIEYRVNPELTMEIYTGMTVDRHASGLGLRTHTPLREGDKVAIIKGLGETHLSGVVRWCSKEDGTYKAGLSISNN